MGFEGIVELQENVSASGCFFKELLRRLTGHILGTEVEQEGTLLMGACRQSRLRSGLVTSPFPKK